MTNGMDVFRDTPLVFISVGKGKKAKVKFTLEQKVQRESRGVALLFP